MEDLIRSLGEWGWLVAGAVLMILEMLVPGTFLLWFGLAAVITGLLTLAFDLAWQAQTVIFIALSLICVLIGRAVMRRFAAQSHEGDFLNRRADALIGRTFTLNEPIVDGVGRVRVEDTVWRVTGSDLPAGTPVAVKRVDGATLVVEAIVKSDSSNPHVSR